jgi:hypothetical protein
VQRDRQTPGDALYDREQDSKGREEKLIIQDLNPHCSNMVSYSMDETRFPEIIKEIYGLVTEMEAMFPGRHFTPDGHMVGSIGEAIAHYYYGVELFLASHSGHDGKDDNRLIQIKATQGKRISISSEPEYLLAFCLLSDGTFKEIYNGPGNLVWSQLENKQRPKNNQFQISLAKLKVLMQEVPEEQRIKRKRF